MNGMYPFKKRYLLLFIPVIVVIGICIYRTDVKYEDVVEYREEIGKGFDFKGNEVTVKSVEIIGEDYIKDAYADNPMVQSLYEETYKEKVVVMVKIDAMGVNRDVFMDMVGSWHIVVGNDGFGVSFMTDFANGEFTEKKEDKEITLFFGVPEECLKECDYQVMIMSKKYPDQHNIYVDLKE